MTRLTPNAPMLEGPPGAGRPPLTGPAAVIGRWAGSWPQAAHRGGRPGRCARTPGSPSRCPRVSRPGGPRWRAGGHEPIGPRPSTDDCPTTVSSRFRRRRSSGSCLRRTRPRPTRPSTTEVTLGGLTARRLANDDETDDPSASRARIRYCGRDRSSGSSPRSSCLASRAIAWPAVRRDRSWMGSGSGPVSPRSLRASLGPLTVRYSHH